MKCEKIPDLMQCIVNPIEEVTHRQHTQMADCEPKYLRETRRFQSFSGAIQHASAGFDDLCLAK